MANSTTEAAQAIRGLKSSYYSERDELSFDFFRPCLCAFKVYWRAAGYFSASALRSWSGAIQNLVTSPEARIRLLISPQLPETDYEALRSALAPQDRARILDRGGEEFIKRALLW